MGASLVASSARKNPGGTTSTVVPPAGIAAGDLLLVPWVAGASGASTTDHAAKGWWRYGARAFNTRTFAVYARIYNPADPASVYTLTQGASANAKWAELVIRGHSVTAETDIQVGASWIRGENGGSQGPIVALTLTAAAAGMAFAFTGEASSPLGGYTVTQANGFALAAEITEGPTAGSEIEWVTAWQKQVTPGPTGNLEITHGANASLNGIGLQVLIPAPAATPAQGTAAATSGATGAPSGRSPAAGTSAALSATSAAPAARTPAAGTAPVLSVVAGAGGSVHPAASTVPVLSSVSGAAVAAYPASGTIPVTSEAAGTPDVLTPGKAEGVVVVGSAVTGAPTATHPATGRVDAGSATAAAGTLTSPASGIVTAETRIVGTPTGPRVSRMVFTPTTHPLSAPSTRSRTLPPPLSRPRPLTPPVWPTT